MAIRTISSLISNPQFLSRLSELGSSAIEMRESTFTVNNHFVCSPTHTDNTMLHVRSISNHENLLMEIHNHPCVTTSILDFFSEKDINRPKIGSTIIGLVSVFLSDNDKVSLRLLLTQCREESPVTSQLHYNYEQTIVKMDEDPDAITSAKCAVDALIMSGFNACAMIYSFDTNQLIVKDLEHIIGKTDLFNLQKKRTSKFKKLLHILNIALDTEKLRTTIYNRFQSIAFDTILGLLPSNIKTIWSLVLRMAVLKIPVKTAIEVSTKLHNKNDIDVSKILTEPEMGHFLFSYFRIDQIEQLVQGGFLKVEERIKLNSGVTHLLLHKPAKVDLNAMLENSLEAPRCFTHFTGLAMFVTLLAKEKNDGSPMYCKISFKDLLIKLDVKNLVLTHDPKTAQSLEEVYQIFDECLNENIRLLHEKHNS